MSDPSKFGQPVWMKSSFSTADCVEVGQLSPDGPVAVRSSNQPNAQPLIFSREEWAAFVAGVKAGEFDPV